MFTQIGFLSVYSFNASVRKSRYEKVRFCISMLNYGVLS